MIFEMTGLRDQDDRDLALNGIIDFNLRCGMVGVLRDA